jgi:hypothetical protein
MKTMTSRHFLTNLKFYWLNEIPITILTEDGEVIMESSLIHSVDTAEFPVDTDVQFKNGKVFWFRLKDNILIENNKDFCSSNILSKYNVHDEDGNFERYVSCIIQPSKK